MLSCLAAKAANVASMDFARLDELFKLSVHKG